MHRINWAIRRLASQLVRSNPIQSDHLIGRAANQSDCIEAKVILMSSHVKHINFKSLIYETTVVSWGQSFSLLFVGSCPDFSFCSCCRATKNQHFSRWGEARKCEKNNAKQVEASLFFISKAVTVFKLVSDTKAYGPRTEESFDRSTNTIKQAHAGQYHDLRRKCQFHLTLLV